MQRICSTRDGLGFDARPCISMLGIVLNCLMLNPNRVIAKEVKSCTHCYYVRCTKKYSTVTVSATCEANVDTAITDAFMASLKVGSPRVTEPVIKITFSGSFIGFTYFF